MSDLRAIGSSLLLGSAVLGVELVGLGEWLAKPALGGVVAFAFFLLQRRVTKAAEAEKAAEAAAAAERAGLSATLASLRNDLTALRQDLAMLGAGSIAVLEQRVASCEKYDGDLHERVEGIHSNWTKRHAELQHGIDAADVTATDAKHAAIVLDTRLTALERDHAARHLTPLSRS